MNNLPKLLAEHGLRELSKRQILLTAIKVLKLKKKVLKLVEIFQGIMEKIQKVVLKKVNNNLAIR